MPRGVSVMTPKKRERFLEWFGVWKDNRWKSGVPTQRQIAAELGVCRQRVQQLCERVRDLA